MPTFVSTDFSVHRRTSFLTRVYTTRAEATTSFPISGAFHLASTIGVEQVKYREEGTTSILNGAFSDTQPSYISTFQARNRLKSTFGQLDLTWKNRVSLAGGLRHERVRYGYSAEDYPSVGIAWRLSGEPWFPRHGVVNMLRLHYAYGRAGLSRSPLGTELESRARMPVARESEAGLQAEILDGRAMLALTYYRGRSDEASVEGVPFEFVNAPRSVHSSGVALFDYRGGHELFNRTAYSRCGVHHVCRASQDRESPLADQARSVAATLGSPAGYIEDAGYWKFRELSVNVAAPEPWAAKVGASRLTLILAARNLATWTRYGGTDPEVNSDGYESLLTTDTYSQPEVRYFMLRLDIGWWRRRADARAHRAIALHVRDGSRSCARARCSTRGELRQRPLRHPTFRPVICAELSSPP